jgi:orotate phosphoribosyltransferase
VKKLTFISYAQLHEDVRAFARKVDAGAVVGVPRSGAMVAYLLSIHSHLPVCGFESFLKGAPFRVQGGAVVDVSGPVLVLDDSCGSGGTMSATAERVRAAGRPEKIIFGALYSKPKTRFKLDVFLRVIGSPRIFEWNLWHHHYLRRSLVDFDGVLCCDPPRDDDREGGSYSRFIAGAPPLYLPREHVLGVVTNRLEKWRGVSQRWLDGHGVVAKELIMANYRSAKERRAKHSYGKWKGQVYAKSPASLFIESSSVQGKDIFSESRKTVLCLDEMRLFQ